MADAFDWRNPDYDAVWKERAARLALIRSKPGMAAGLKEYYAEAPADFINDWGMTFDPRNVERGLPAYVPFILFPKQREWIEWVVDHWKRQKPGLTEKSRDSGISWLEVSLGCALGLHHDGVVIGYGSRLAEYVDKIGEPKSLFYKARLFMQELPVEFRGGWDSTRHASHMRIIFPETGSMLSGEGGDNIGRGNRTSVYMVDEAAYLKQPHRVEMALSQTTNCRMDVSTPNGMGNPFEQKRHGGKVDVFTFHWRDDPRKDDAWYAKQVAEINDPVIVAQELDIDYSASVEGILIPRAWIMAAVDACEKLKIKPTGERFGAMDVADEGRDMNAFCGAYGVQVEHLDEWSGKGADIYESVERGFAICDAHGYPGFRYDADGLGAGVRGDARIINAGRAKGNVKQLQVEPFWGSGAVLNPEGEDVKGRKNKDYFMNRKAQGGFALRRRFQLTHRWVVNAIPCHPDEIISIPSKVPFFTKLLSELSQPTFSKSPVGKIIIDKSPEGARSPNLYDGLMIRFAQASRAPVAVSPGALALSMMRGGRRR